MLETVDCVGRAALKMLRLRCGHHTWSGHESEPEGLGETGQKAVADIRHFLL